MLNNNSLPKLNLHSSQMRENQLCHNAGWYNSQGNKIGWGDLSPDDFVNIKAKLQPNEIFLILREYDSFWNFVIKFGIIGDMCETKTSEQNPGIDYISEKAIWMITPDIIYQCSEYAKENEEFQGTVWQNIKREEVKHLIEKFNK